jgi:hypothetical protein
MDDLATQAKRKIRSRKKNLESQQEATTSGGNVNVEEHQKVKRKRDTQTNVDLCDKLAKAFSGAIIASKNEQFRQNCFKILHVNSGADAEAKIYALANKLQESANAKRKKKSA